MSLILSEPSTSYPVWCFLVLRMLYGCSARTKLTFPVRYLWFRARAYLPNVWISRRKWSIKQPSFRQVFSLRFSPLRPESRSLQATIIHNIYFFRVVGKCSYTVSRIKGYFAASIFSSFVCTYVVLSFSGLDHLMLSLSFAHLAAENSSDLSLYDDVNAVCESFLTTMLAYSLITVFCTSGRRSSTIFRALITDSGTMANTRGRGPLCKRD